MFGMGLIEIVVIVVVVAAIWAFLSGRRPPQ